MDGLRHLEDLQECLAHNLEEAYQRGLKEGREQATQEIIDLLQGRLTVNEPPVNEPPMNEPPVNEPRRKIISLLQQRATMNEPSPALNGAQQSALVWLEANPGASQHLAYTLGAVGNRSVFYTLERMGYARKDGPRFYAVPSR